MIVSLTNTLEQQPDWFTSLLLYFNLSDFFSVFRIEINVCISSDVWHQGQDIFLVSFSSKPNKSGTHTILLHILFINAPVADNIFITEGIEIEQFLISIFQELISETFRNDRNEHVMDGCHEQDNPDG